MQLKRTTGFTVSTSSFVNILKAVAELRPSEAFYVFLGGFLELAAYSQARMDSRKNKIPFIWEPIRSTKVSIRV
jgi:hypothetical protein